MKATNLSADRLRDTIIEFLRVQVDIATVDIKPHKYSRIPSSTRSYSKPSIYWGGSLMNHVIRNICQYSTKI